MKVNQQPKINVNPQGIINRLKNKKDRVNFCREMNWDSTNNTAYVSNYFLKVLMGEKKYLLSNFNIGYKPRYFKKGITLIKKYIISKILGNPTYASYTPDNVNTEKL